MRYIYINQDGVLGDYIKPLRRHSKTGFKRVQNLQIFLEQTVLHYSNLPATEGNSELLWGSIRAVAKKATAGMTEMELKCDAYLEIEKWVGEIGQQIAFGAKRRGIDEYTGYVYMMKFRDMESGNPSFIKAYLQFLTCMTSTGFRSADSAEALFARIDTMTDEELIEEGLREQERIKYLKADRQVAGCSLRKEAEETPF